MKKLRRRRRPPSRLFKGRSAPLELARRLESLEAGLRRLLDFEALRAIDPGFRLAEVDRVFEGLEPARLWRDFDYRRGRSGPVDLVTDQIIDLVWHDRSLDVAKSLDILMGAYELTVDKRAYCLSRVIIYWTAHQFFAPDFDLGRCIRQFELTEGAWGGFEFTWAEIIAWLAENGQPSQALEFLDRHQRVYGLAAIDEYLPAALFAHRQGRTNELIRRSAELYASFLRSIEEGLLAGLLRARETIALVGNGPAEAGLGRGPEIDGHELVIRFNDYCLQAGHAADYGRRTDLWVTNFKRSGRPDSYESIGYILYMLSPWEHRYKPGLVRKLLDVSDRGRKKLICFSPEERRRCCSLYRPVKSPSSGFEFLAALKHYRPDFRADDVYGFSFKAGVEEAHHFDHYYCYNTDRSTIHDCKLEEQLIRQMFA